jgi:aldehyde dehydrogenase (NAD+)
MGPLVDEAAVSNFSAAVGIAQEQGGTSCSTGVARASTVGGHFVEPTIVEIAADAPIVAEETFAPILYVLECEDVKDASASTTGSPRACRRRCSRRRCSRPSSSCPMRVRTAVIANVNIGTSGAEIGGAFGGEKATGGGRESGSDAWKAYMRRQTNTINWGDELPLAQGIEFG